MGFYHQLKMGVHGARRYWDSAAALETGLSVVDRTPQGLRSWICPTIWVGGIWQFATTPDSFAILENPQNSEKNAKRQVIDWKPPQARGRPVDV